MDEKFLVKLQDTLQRNPVIDESHLKRTLTKAEMELSKRKKRDRIGFLEFFIRQIKYLSVPIWCLQGILLFFLLSTLGYLYGALAMTSEKQLAVLLCSCVILILLTTIPVIERSIRYQMNMVEAATKFSIKSILAAKLLTIGLGDGAMIVAVMLFTVKQTSLSILQAITYLMVPFLLLSSVALYLIGHVAVEKYVKGCVTASMILFLVVFLLGENSPWILKEAFITERVVFCLVLCVVLLKQIQYIRNHSSIAELQIV